MKRFTDTCKWDDPWFRSLNYSAKLVFFYVIDRCDNGGFLEFDLDGMAFHTKLQPSTIQGALKDLERGIKEASGWLWVRRFLKHQKNDDLNPSNPAHKQIISILREQSRRFSHLDEFLEFLAPYKGLVEPHRIGKGIGNGLQGEEVQEKRGASKAGFSDFWTAYPKKKAKGDAEKAWLTMRGSDHLEAILGGITASRKSDQWLKDGGRYIPHPAHWLRSRSWEDSHETISAKVIIPMVVGENDLTFDKWKEQE